MICLMARREINRGRTEGERLAYQRGYNNGRNRAWGQNWKMLDIARAWRAKAKGGYPAQATCAGCLYFSKEQPSHKYGRCSQDVIDGAYEGTVHAAFKEWKSNPPALVLLVDEDFGCINWRPKPAEAA